MAAAAPDISGLRARAAEAGALRPPYIVYLHAWLLARGRGLEPPAPLEPKDFAARLGRKGFALLVAPARGAPAPPEARGPRTAREGTGAGLAVALVAPGSSAAASSPDLKKLVLDPVARSLGGEPAEVLVLLPPPSQNLVDRSKQIRQQLRKKAADSSGDTVWFRLFPYDLCAYDLPRRVDAVRHRPLPPAEAAAVLDRELLRPDQLRRIFAADPGAVWAGADAGEVVELGRPSEEVGTALEYALIV